MTKTDGLNGRVAFPTMLELIRTDDLVFASWLESRLAGAGITAYVFDAYTSSLYGSALDAVQRRILVEEDDLFRARRVLQEAEGCRDE